MFENYTGKVCSPSCRALANFSKTPEKIQDMYQQTSEPLVAEARSEFEVVV